MAQHLLSAYAVDIDFRLHGFERANENGYKVEATEIEPGVIYEDERVTVEAFTVSHGTLESYGYKFTTKDGKTVVISGDTAPLDIVAEKAKNCDILCCTRSSMPPALPRANRSGRNITARCIRSART